jgi:hypothetical protein
MPRLPRLKVEGEDAWYHLWNSATGRKRAFPLQDEVARHEFTRLLQFYARIYFCRVAAFEVMGSHVLYGDPQNTSTLWPCPNVKTRWHARSITRTNATACI